MTALLPALVLLMLAGGSSPFEPAPLPPKPKPGPKPPYGGGDLPVEPVEPKPTPSPAKPVTPSAPVKPAPSAKKSPVVPVAWPQAKPQGLPAFPSGWEPDTPPPAAVTQRAYALLPSLWKSGKAGATTVEQTGGRWITYQGFTPSKGKRGVAAWRLKGNPGAGTIQM